MVEESNPHSYWRVRLHAVKDKLSRRGVREGRALSLLALVGRSALLIFLSAGSDLAISQRPGMDDLAAGTASDDYGQLPIDDSRRTALRRAVQAREYGHAEMLLVDEIKRQPKSQVLLTTLGGVFFLDGKYLNCAVALKKAQALAPLPAHDDFTLALSYIILKHEDWARPELEKLAASDPLNSLYPYWVGRIEYDAMNFEAAVSRFQKALSLRPSFMKAYDNLGLCYEALGRYDEAIGIYQRAVLVNRSERLPSPWPPLNLGTLLVKLGRLDDAKPLLEESLQDSPRFPRAQYQMGLLLHKEKKDEEALHELLEAARNDPSFPEPHYLLGQIYTRRGEESKAESEWRIFQKLKQQSPNARPE